MSHPPTHGAGFRLRTSGSGPSRFARRALASLACSFAVAASGACGDDEETAPTPVGPKGTIELTILSVEATSGASVPGEGGGDLSLACDGFAHVHVELVNWQLRPPDACAGAKQCGWLVLRIDPEGVQPLEERSAACTSIVERDNACLSAVITVDASALATFETSHRFHVELRYSDGTPVLSGGNVLSDEVSVNLRAGAGCAVSDAAAAADAADGGESGTAPPDSSAGADAADAPAEAASDAPADAASEVSDATDEAG